jgi:transcriptional regulator with XRE-family HTH domain
VSSIAGDHVSVKPLEREQARALRAEGLAMKDIARRVGVSVSSVSLWTRDIKLTAEQLAAIAERDRRSPNRRRGTEVRSARARLVREAAQQHGRELARRGDPLHVAGAMLYWAEGTKHRNTLGFCNSDPGMQELFLRFLRTCYAVDDDKVSLAVNCHLGNGISLRQIEDWWLERLALPRTSLRAASVNRPSRASRFRRNTLMYGTVTVRVHSTFIVQSIYGAIQEYSGIDRPEWIDCHPPPQPATKPDPGGAGTGRR